MLYEKVIKNAFLVKEAAFEVDLIYTLFFVLQHNRLSFLYFDMQRSFRHFFDFFDLFEPMVAQQSPSFS